jgi:NADH-quinone oxidoreductase subunit H
VEVRDRKWRDFFGGCANRQGMDWQLLFYLATTVVKSALVIGIVLGVVSYTVMAERRISAAIQDRIGPNRVGIPLTNFSLFGLGQPIADAVKFLLKEDFTPGHVNRVYFVLAPALAVIPALVSVAVLPFGSVKAIEIPGWGVTLPHPGVIADVDVGVLLLFAIASLGVYGIVLAGWASNSKYPFLGGIRSSAQMISYEIAMGLSVVPVFMVIGSLNLSDIVRYQYENGWMVLPFIQGDWRPDGLHWLLWPSMVLSFLIFLVASFAETNRAPFDLPESETELVGGYHTEYSSMKFALFFLGEYAAMIVASGLIVTLFFGGWTLPFGWFAGEEAAWWMLPLQGLVFLGKIACVIFFFIWVRWTVPRFRYDQLMKLGWCVFLELALANIIFVAVILAFWGR